VSPFAALARPRIVAFEAPHAPIALAGGRTLLRVVIEGSGVLFIAGARRRFVGGLDDVFLVPVTPRVRLRVRGLFPFLPGDAREVLLTPLSPAPPAVAVDVPLPEPPAPRVAPPDLRPAAPGFSPRMFSPRRGDRR
jgi:hypothetical protein